MREIQWAISVLLLASFANAVAYGGISNVNEFSLKPIKKGLTFQANIWPSYETNWAGRFSCNNCNPFEGDQTCNKSLPLVCITFAKAVERPHYRIAVEYTPFAILDGGYYEGWTGGVLQVTVPVRGYDVVDYTYGDNLCKGYFGPNAKWAKFNDGFYLPFMNQRPVKAWNLWDWDAAKRGGWNLWGYFNHHYRGRAWVYVDGQPNGNCGN
jgi:hypothetical protein